MNPELFTSADDHRVSAVGLASTPLPSITIVIASLHDDDALKASVASCLAQTGVEVHLVLSLKSADNPPQVERRLEATKSVVIVRRNDSGIANAWNGALDYVETDFVGFLGAGDYFDSPQSLAALVRNAKGFDAANLVLYGDQQVLRRDGASTPFPRPPVGLEKKALEGRMAIPHASSLWPTALLRCLRFDESFRIALDYEFALRSLELVQYRHVATRVAVITTDGLSNRPRSLLRVIAEDARAKRNNGLSPYSSPVLNLKRFLRWMSSPLTSRS